MDCIQYSSTGVLPFKTAEIHYSPKFTHKFSFTAELCGIFLGEIPFNHDFDALVFPVNSNRTPSGTLRIGQYHHRHYPSDPSKTELPHKSPKKCNTAFGLGSKRLSNDSLQKSESFYSHNKIAMRFNSVCRNQLEACRISGSITFSDRCLVFISRDCDLRLPACLGGPGYLEPNSPTGPNFVDYGYPLNCGHVNSGTIFDLSHWTMENDTHFSCQSLLSYQSGCFAGGRKFWSNVNSPANLRKRGLKQFWTTLLSKKSKQTRPVMESEAPSIQTLVPADTSPSSPQETLRLEWPLTTLRQFAFNGCLFKMEAGRKAPHGEGQYLFRIPDIAEFRQNLEAHIEHQKRSRNLKTRSAVCYSTTRRSSPPPVPAPPPPLSGTIRDYANIPSTITTPRSRVNQSWTNLLPQQQREAGEGLSMLDVVDSDWLAELSAPPPPPPPLQTPSMTVDQESKPSVTRTEEPSMTRVGTYENVRSLLRSRETMSSTLVPNSGDTETSPGACSTLNYAMLDFQKTASLTSGASSLNQASNGASHPQYSARGHICRHRTSSSTCERLVQAPVDIPDRRLARSVDACLNATPENCKEEEGTEEGVESGGNYVDICPLQTLAINELLKSTL